MTYFLVRGLAPRTRRPTKSRAQDGLVMAALARYRIAAPLARAVCSRGMADAARVSERTGSAGRGGAGRGIDGGTAWLSVARGRAALASGWRLQPARSSMSGWLSGKVDAFMNGERTLIGEDAAGNQFWEIPNPVLVALSRDCARALCPHSLGLIADAGHTGRTSRSTARGVVPLARFGGFRYEHGGDRGAPTRPLSAAVTRTGVRSSHTSHMAPV